MPTPNSVESNTNQTAPKDAGQLLTLLSESIDRIEPMWVNFDLAQGKNERIVNMVKNELWPMIEHHIKQPELPLNQIIVLLDAVVKLSQFQIQHPTRPLYTEDNIITLFAHKNPMAFVENKGQEALLAS